MNSLKSQTTIWKISTNIANKAASVNQAPQGQHITQEFVLSAIGLYLAFDGTLSLVYTIIGIYMQLHGKYGTQEVSIESGAYLFGYVLHIIVGLSLVLKAKGWSAVLRSLREYGLSEKPSNK